MRSHMTRRLFLGAGATAAMAATAGPMLAQQPAPASPAPRAKGPRVWLDMDQVELDAAYDQSVYAPNLQQLVKRLARNSDLVRARLGAPQRYAYGPSPIEALDVYTTKHQRADQHLHPRGRVAPGEREELGVCRGAVRPRRRPPRRAGLRLGAGCRRQLAGAGRAGAPGSGLGAWQRAALRR